MAVAELVDVDTRMAEAAGVEPASGEGRAGAAGRRWGAVPAKEQGSMASRPAR